MTTQDLLHVPYNSESYGFGTGRPIKWYSLKALEDAALAKHGAAGLAKKRAAREKRRLNQQRKIEQAKRSKEQFEN